MNKIFVILVVAIVLAGGAAAYLLIDSDDDGVSAEGITIIDDRGKEITFEKAPEKIMSLGSSFTDTLVTLGCIDQIYAVDSSSITRLSEYDLSNKVEISSGKPTTTTAEFALERGVDCVIVWNFSSYSDGIAAIEKVGVNVVALYPKDIESVKEIIKVIGTMMDKEEDANDLVAEMEKIIEDITALAKGIAGNNYGNYKRVYVELDSASGGNYNTPGTNTITGSLLDMLGVNYFAKEEGMASAGYAQTEALIKFSPDIMIFMGPRDQTHTEILRNNALDLNNSTIIIYNNDTEDGFNGNWASATPSFIKGLIYLFEVIYGESYSLGG